MPSVAAAAAHVRGLAQRSLADLAMAVHLGERSGRSLAPASALEDLARLHVDDGDPGDAVDILDRALAIHLEVGAHWDAARVRRRLREMGVRRRSSFADGPRSGWVALTAAETVVADLVCEGRTNRQIGEQLFVSPYTVNTHLRHIFEKLGVNSRVELTRAAIDRRH